MSLRSVERIRKRKNEDEEIMFVILPALHLHLTCPRERVKRHLSFLYGKERVRELLGGHLKNCLVAFRMEPHIFILPICRTVLVRLMGLMFQSREHQTVRHHGGIEKAH
uniref:Uncharacterized protein n=2 Tax=Avena sativa TaxID=4498 RepID=A0ACD5VPM5_AVESA